jgi:hypothetical protein
MNVGGRGARGEGAINKIGWGGGYQVKYRRTMFWVMHDILLKLHPGRTLSYAVARASVAPMRLHRPIHHKGINTLRIIAASEGEGGGSLIAILAFG